MECTEETQTYAFPFLIRNILVYLNGIQIGQRFDMKRTHRSNSQPLPLKPRSFIETFLNNTDFLYLMCCTDIFPVHNCDLVVR